MDPITQQAVFAAAGAGGGAKTYVDDVFSTFLYDGNGGTQAINNGIDLAGEGGMLWVKSRNNSFAENHTILDTERPIKVNENGYPYLASNSTNQEAESGLTSFNSNGFTWGSGNNQYNGSLEYVSWSFRKAPGFFDVITFTGNGSNQSIAHNLGSVPGCIMFKNTSTADHWVVYHRGISVPAEKALVLNEPWAEDDDTYFNDTAPTSTHFTVGPKAQTNGNGNTIVAYVFAHDDAQFGTDEDESIIKCGSYTGGGSTSVEVNLGFEPQWLLIKSADGGYGWGITDNMRGISPGDDARLMPDSDSEEQNSDLLDLTATGFQTRNNANTNRQGHNFVYMAIRRPHKPPEAATDVFAIDTYTGSIPNYISGFPVDLAINRDGVNSGGDGSVFSRLIGTKRLKTNSSEAEGNAFSAAEMDYSNGYASGSGTNPINDNYSWMFKRAPGFMDVVTYSGTASNLNVSHNLGVAPEFLIVKRRSAAEDWTCYHSSLGNTKYITLNSSSVAGSLSTGWNNTDPTSTVFTVGTHSRTNGSGQTYIALLFATLPGISKVGSYSGTGNDINVDCGFTSGARFVLIKRSDTEISGATGTNWYFWDSTRGIVSGNDPYLLLNRDNNGTDAQVTNTDYIDPLNAGFTVTSSAPAALNASGGTYIFLAIA